MVALQRYDPTELPMMIFKCKYQIFKFQLVIMDFLGFDPNVF